MTVSEKTAKPSRQEVITQLTAERQELLELCQQLSAGEWDTPSLCKGWRVRDVVAHVCGGQSELWAYLKAGGGDRGNQKIVDKRKDFNIHDLLREVETFVTPNRLAKLGPNVFLWDNWVHQQDVRWALGADRQRTQNPARLQMILNGPARRAVKKQAGLQFKATDLDWQAGEGLVVNGPAEAIIMALAGRPMALDRLNGPGLAILRERIKSIKA
jgi:uncharacterized protein (TIGR03083 family)